ncbi:MAG: protein kinase domain-containing protein [Thermoanaerobaculia bacterium]
MTLAAGSKLGPYEILAPLGAGGMGEVYRAKDSKLKRDVAIKVLPESLATDADALARFEREAHAVAALNHPNILSIHDFGNEGDVAYAVMELLEGETLRAKVEGGALPQRRAVEIAIQIARGLAAAHEKGIVHRDLKPENVFLTADGRVKILDFGLAKRVGMEATETNAPTAAGTEPGTVMGTVGYMSPEQVRGRNVDHRTDIFAFGAILYEMLTGRRAFKGDSHVETMNSILKEEPPELADSGRSVSPALDRIVRHCLEKSPEGRFHSAGDIAFDLENLSGATSTASGAALRARTRRIGWREILPLALLLALPIAYFLGTRAHRAEKTSFRAFTFRRGTIRSARFAPDAHTIVYGAAWQGAPIKLFSATVDHPESAPISLPDADVFAVNADGQLLISLGRRYLTTHHGIGSLALAPLAGGAPHELLENVQAADFGPDGKSIAVIREVEGKNRLEYPIGKPLCETVGWMSNVRVSPKGDLVAFFDHNLRWDNRGTVAVVDLQGHKKILTPIYDSEEGLTWSPSGDEIWYSSGYGLAGDGVLAVTPAGRMRLVYQGVGDMAIFDAARDGKVIVSRSLDQREMLFGRPGESRERDLSWFDWSIPIDMLASGEAVLFNESGAGSGASYGVYMRRTDGSPAVRIGDGAPSSLSPDGKFALATDVSSPQQIVRLPTGAGEPKTLLFGSVEGAYGVWFPNGRQILLEGHEQGHGSRLYVAGSDGGAVAPISGEGVHIDGADPISPDGSLLTATGRDGKAYVYPVHGGEPRLIPGLTDDDEISRWTADGKALFVFRHGELPAKVVRLDLATGKREPWKDILPGDPSGVVTITPILLTPDGKTYAYSYPRILSQLFLGEGLK